MAYGAVFEENPIDVRVPGGAFLSDRFARERVISSLTSPFFAAFFRFRGAFSLSTLFDGFCLSPSSPEGASSPPSDSEDSAPEVPGPSSG